MSLPSNSSRLSYQELNNILEEQIMKERKNIIEQKKIAKSSSIAKNNQSIVKQESEQKNRRPPLSLTPRPSTVPKILPSSTSATAAALTTIKKTRARFTELKKTLSASANKAIVEKTTTSSIASAAFAPLLRKYASPLLPTPMTQPSMAWTNKISGDDSKGSSSKVQGKQDSFNSFREKWEAKQETRGNKSGVEIEIIKIVTDSSENKDKMDDRNRGTEKVLRAGSGGIEGGNANTKIFRNSSMEERNVQERLMTWPATGESIQQQSKKVLSSSMVNEEGTRQRIKLTDMDHTKSVKRSLSPISRVLRDREPPILDPASKSSKPNKRLGSHHKMPNSWKVTQEFSSKPKKDLVQEIIMTSSSKPSFHQSISNHQQLTFASPMELQYPFTSSSIPKLHNFAWDAKRQSQSSFGNYISTSSLLNPIILGLPRLNKPQQTTNMNMEGEMKAMTDSNTSNVDHKPFVAVSAPDPLPFRYFSNVFPEKTMVEGLSSEEESSDYGEDDKCM